MTENFSLVWLSKVFALSVCFLLDASLLGLPADVAALAVVGSLSGALVLAYTEHWKGWVNVSINTLLATICGLFCGSFAVRYLHLSDLADLGLTFFLSGSLSLVGVVALISLWRGNAGRILTWLAHSKFNVPSRESDAAETKKRRS